MAEELTVEELTAEMPEVAAPYGLIAIGVTAGIGVGLIGGYFAAKKLLSTKYQEVAEQEIAEMREHYQEERARIAASKVAQDPKPELDSLVEDLGYISDAIEQGWTPEEEAALEEAESEEEAEEVVSNVFETHKNEWDYSIETRLRSKDAPYILHADEFRENENDWDQTTFTYFVGDEVLCDIRDAEVDDVDGFVGSENLTKFGHGSNDDDVLYIRNEELQLEMEILRSNGKYSHEVHGEVKHANTPQHRPNRRFDDE